MPYSIRAFIILASASVILKATYLLGFSADILAGLERVVDVTDLAVPIMRAAVVIGSALYLGLIAMAGFGHVNLARWFFLALTAYAVALTPMLFLAPDGIQPEGLVDITCVVLRLAALGFVFSPNAKTWFTPTTPA